MSEPHKNNRSKSHEPELDDSDEIGELEEDNSFEKNNEVFDLKSQINLLKIQKQKVALQHETAFKALQAKNSQLSNMLHMKKKENVSLQASVARLQQENDELRHQVETQRKQIESVNRKTADFHHSVTDNSQFGDPSDLINQLLTKDKQIQALKKKLSQSGATTVNQLSLTLGVSDRQRYEQQIRTLKGTLEDVRRKQTMYKRQYESMIQSKEEIIRKMSMQGEEQNKRLLQIKDKQISDLKREIEESGKIISQYKSQIRAAADKLGEMQLKMMQKSQQFTRETQSLNQSHEIQKQALTKQLTDKVRRQLKQNQEKIAASQQRVYQLQTQLQLQRQQLSKYKSEASSLNQFNTYLESSNKQYEQSKQKLQKMLYEKQKQINELKQSQFREMAELKGAMVQYRSESERKVVALEQELIAAKYIAEKLENQLKHREQKQESLQGQSQNVIMQQIQALRNEKMYLSQQLSQLQARYNEKTERLLEIQSRVITQYEQRIRQLEANLNRSRQNSNAEKKQLIMTSEQSKETLDEQYKKLQMICELLQIEKQQKNAEIKKISEERIGIEVQLKTNKDQIEELEKKLKDKGEDYTSLQLIYEQLQDKYKRGVRDLQQQIKSMFIKIQQQHRRAEKIKLQGREVEDELRTEIRSYKAKVKQLQAQLQSTSEKHRQQSEQAEAKLQKLSNQITLVTREREQLQRQQMATLRDKQQKQQQQKQKLFEYIQELEQNNQILTQKVAIFANKDSLNQATIDKLDKQVKTLKLEYSASLQEINQLLQKCKQLEQVSRESIHHMEQLKQKHDKLSIGYQQLLNQNNRKNQQLKSTYNQLNKLTHSLQARDQSTVRSAQHHQRSTAQFSHISYPHYSRVSTTRQYPTVPTVSTMPTTPPVPTHTHTENAQSRCQLPSSYPQHENHYSPLGVLQVPKYHI